MEPLIIALICAAAFGTVVAISAFVRQLLLSRDKHLNDEAQRKALAQEAVELQIMREQMQSNKRFDSHYKVMGANKEAIFYLDTKIEDILKKKAILVDRYSQITLNESDSIIKGEISLERKLACDRLKQEIDEEMQFYDKELNQLQQRRTSLWETHKELENYLLLQEKARNESLDMIYKKHTGLLEKIYIRHAESSEHLAKQSIDAGTTSFKTMILAPIQFLLQYFNLSTGISITQAQIEKAARDNVNDVEKEVNDADKNAGDKADEVEHADKDEHTEDEEHSPQKESQPSMEAEGIALK